VCGAARARPWITLRRRQDLRQKAFSSVSQKGVLTTIA